MNPYDKTHFDGRRPLAGNPGLARDFYPGEVAIPEHSRMLADDAVVEKIMSDEMPLPATQDRENYYGDRHLEYWLSGHADYCKLAPYLGLDAGRRTYLDFGGATGRVARHVTRNPQIETWLCDINANWIAWIDQYFNRPLFAFQNRIYPALPLEDRYFDLVTGLSVFTHLDRDEMPWLLELRRIVKPGGFLYLTILDENVWDRLKDPNWAWLRKSLAAGRNDEYLEQRCQEPLEERVVLEYSAAEAYNSNTFLPRQYVERKWGPLFCNMEFINDHHNFQTVVVLQRP
jgi:SAM-dependent methyltransferase